MNDTNNKNNSGTQGFGSMDPEKQREIASKGGKAAHKSGKAFEWDSQSAKEAGQKGGQSRSDNSESETEE